jgi:hypothetical protein
MISTAAVTVMKMVRHVILFQHLRLLVNLYRIVQINEEQEMENVYWTMTIVWYIKMSNWLHIVERISCFGMLIVLPVVREHHKQKKPAVLCLIGNCHCDTVVTLKQKGVRWCYVVPAFPKKSWRKQQQDAPSDVLENDSLKIVSF